MQFQVEVNNPEQDIRPGAVVVALLLIALCGPAALAQNHGLTVAEPLQPYLGSTFPTLPPGGATSWEVVNAFPNLVFRDPIQLIELPTTGDFLIAGKAGEIWIVPNDSATTSKTKILDIQDAVLQEVDGGMLNVILHPEFGQPGSPNREYLYIYYRYTPEPAHTGRNAYMRLSRFVMDEVTQIIDPVSEFVMIQQYDRHDWHQGGGMFFGPDEFLYITVGDEGGANDEYDSAQRLNEGLFSGVLRIDVDQDPARSHPIRRQPLEPASPPAGWPGTFSQGYYIPNDNPWVDPSGDTLEEFWAIGLRSPHRMSYDPVTGDIWVGDVGQATREEVTRVYKGANMQWPYKEGTLDGQQPMPSPLIGFEQPPEYDYPRSDGTCVIGGFVYRGAKWATELTGKYIFGDHTVRNVWALTPTGDGNPPVDFMVNVPSGGVGSKNGISSFATDAAGEIYILKLFGTDEDGGIIYKLNQAGAVPEPPTLLSQLGIFSDLSTLQPAPGFVPYTVNAPLWSDGSVKGRWVGVPNDGTHDTPDEQIIAGAYGDWKFPQGTIFVKHFELPLDANDSAQIERLETRVLVIDENDESYGLTYRWNEAQTDATLLLTGESEIYDVTLGDGSTVEQEWDYPARNDCTTCHNANAGWVRGVSTQQLNGDLLYPSTGVTDNQLRALSHIGMLRPGFREADLPLLPKSDSIDTVTYDRAHLVRSYLDSNCAQCHRPNGVNANFDARLIVPLELQNIVDGSVIGSYPALDPKVISPSDPANSIMLQRVGSASFDQMPPLARNVVHDRAVSVLADWVDDLAPGQQLCDRMELPIPQEDYSVVLAGGGQGGLTVDLAFDGRPDTFWLTPPGTFPNGVQIDLGATYALSGLTLLPRQDGLNVGRIDSMQVFVSDDTIDWSPIASTILPNDAQETRVAFSTTTRYIAVIALSSQDGGTQTSIAELNFLKAKCLTGCDPATPATALNVDEGLAGTELTWAASTSVGALYDVLRASSPGDFSELACVESRDADTLATDTDVPGAGQGYYYLIRSVDGCNGDTAPAGFASDGSARSLPLCPVQP